MKSKSVYSLLLFIIVIVFNFNTQIFAQTTVIKGKLLDVDGNPSKDAQAGTVLKESDYGKDFKYCDEKGNYLVKMTKPGLNFLVLTIPSHHDLKIPILNNKDKELNIDVQLAPYKYKDNFDNVSVGGPFNNYNYGSDKMVKGADGIYRFEVKSNEKEVRYELCGIEGTSRTVNAPGSIKYFPDESGDYWSIAEVVDGKATLVFDPSKLLKKEAEVKVTFGERSSDEKIFRINEEHSKVFADAVQKRQEYYTLHKKMAGFQYERGNYFNDLLNKIEEEKDQEITDILKLSYVTFSMFYPVHYSAEKAASFFDTVSPNNPAWELIPGAFQCFSNLYPQSKWQDLFDNFLKYSKNSSIQAQIFMEELSKAKSLNNEEETAKIHKLIETEYKDNEYAQKLLKMYPIKLRIKIGAEIPEFEVASISNPAEKYSNKSMLGKIYLIDFWATWCGPCVGEMETLHKAYEKYKDKGLEILSLSMDSSPETVAKFRTDKWKMPWKNSFIGSWGSNKMTDTFEVMGIPRPILVSAEGKILETENGLRGEELEKTLSKYFN